MAPHEGRDAFDMISVLMREQQTVNGRGGDAYPLESPQQFAKTEAIVDQNAVATSVHQRGIAAAPTSKRTEPHPSVSESVPAGG